MTEVLALILNIALGVGILALLFKAMRLPFLLEAPAPRARPRRRPTPDAAGARAARTRPARRAGRPAESPT
jgi:hypothetical protein